MGQLVPHGTPRGREPRAGEASAHRRKQAVRAPASGGVEPAGESRIQADEFLYDEPGRARVQLHRLEGLR